MGCRVPSYAVKLYFIVTGIIIQVKSNRTILTSLNLQPKAARYKLTVKLSCYAFKNNLNLQNMQVNLKVSYLNGVKKENSIKLERVAKIASSGGLILLGVVLGVKTHTHTSKYREREREKEENVENDATALIFKGRI